MIRQRRQMPLVGVERGVTPWDGSGHAVLYVSHQSSKLNVSFLPVATGTPSPLPPDTHWAEPSRVRAGSGPALEPFQHSCQVAVSLRSAHARIRARPGHERPTCVSFTHGRPLHRGSRHL